MGKVVGAFVYGFIAAVAFATPDVDAPALLTTTRASPVARAAEVVSTATLRRDLPPNLDSFKVPPFLLRDTLVTQ